MKGVLAVTKLILLMRGGQAHEGGRQQLPPGHPGQVAPLGHPLIQVVGQQKDGAVYHNEKDGRRNKTIDLGFPHKEGVQLPPPM